MKRKLILMLTIAALIITAMGCSGQTEKLEVKDRNASETESGKSDTEQKSGQEDAKPIKMNIMKSGLEKVWTEYYERAINDFTAANPNVTIEYFETPWAERNTKLNVLFASNNAPDVVCDAIAVQAQRAELGQFYPIDEYLESWDDKENMMEHALELGVYQGKTYGLGYHWDPRLFAYRKDFFEEAGLNPEEPPKNFEELKTYAQKLVKKDGDIVSRSGMDIPLTKATNYFSIFARQNGAVIVDEDKQVPLINEPECVQALEYLVDFYNMGVAIEFNALNAAEKPFLNGKAAMAYITPSQLKSFIEADPEMKDKVGLLPYFDEKAKATFGGLYQYFISSQSSHKDNAWDFIAFMLSKDETWKRYQKVSSPVVRKDLVDEYIKAGQFNEVIYKAASASYPLPNVPWTGTFRKYVEQAYEAAMLAEMAPQKALDAAQEELKQEIK